MEIGHPRLAASSRRALGALAAVGVSARAARARCSASVRSSRAAVPARPRARCWTRFDAGGRPASSSSRSRRGSRVSASRTARRRRHLALLVLLTTLLTPLVLFAAPQSIHKRVKGFLVSMLLLETAMLGAFVALDLVLFYVFWEVMLLPMFLIIGVWGGERRVYAAHQVLPLHDGRQPADAGRDPLPRAAPRRGRGALRASR